MSSALVNRSLFRSLLRSSQFGRNPEIFGEFGLQYSPTANLPSDIKQQLGINDNNILLSGSHTAQQVRKSIRSAFLHAPKDEDSFAVLRRANQLSSILVPKRALDMKTLPIFQFSGQAMLTGETSRFVFFEPR
jgi:hypothetical protein